MVGRYLLLQENHWICQVKVIFQKHLREKLVLLHLILLKNSQNIVELFVCLGNFNSQN